MEDMSGEQLVGEIRTSPLPFVENVRKFAIISDKISVHLRIKCLIKNAVLRVSNRKNSNIFPYKFFLVLQNVYRSTLFLVNSTTLKNS